jgi:exonuclease SbcD
VPRILHTADWHLGRRLEGRPRHEEQVAVLDEICRIADDERVDVVLIAGDVFDTSVPPAEAEQLFYRTMARLADNARRAVIVLAGNHDSPDRLIASDPYARELGITTIGFPKDVPPTYEGGRDRVACVAAGPSRVTLRLPGAAKPLTVLALPYPSETRLREVLSERLDDDVAAARDYNARIARFMQDAVAEFPSDCHAIIASHLYVHGGVECDSERQIQVGGAYSVDTRSFPAAASYVALGHLHRPQEQHGIEDAAVRYSGSILQYSFSEAEQKKSVTIVDITDAGTTHREVPLTAGRTLFNWSTLKSLTELESRLAAADPNGWYSITVEVDEPIAPDYVASLRARHPGIINCIPRYRREESDATDAVRLTDLSLEQQFRRYIDSRYLEPVSDAVMKLFLELAGNQRDEG